jgi:serine/threonine protein kinase
VREIAIQALQAIEFLHSIKLTHTDLKPENILLKSDRKEIILDES